MFDIQEIGDGIVNSPDLKMVCSILNETWAELYLDKSVIEQEKRRIVSDMTALLSTRLQSIKNIEEQKLKKHRVLIARTELEHWWIKCHFSEEQKREFEPYFSQDYTDELLTVHKEELKKLQQYHADNLYLFEVIDEYMKLFERHLQLEAQCKNPNRLFENRGGQLLKDERDRKAAQKELPKMEKKITSLTSSFEQTYGRPFTINGINFEDSLKLHAQKFKENIEVFQLPKCSDTKICRTSSALKRKIAMPVTPCSESKQHCKIQKLSVRKTLLQ